DITILFVFFYLNASKKKFLHAILNLENKWSVNEMFKKIMVAFFAVILLAFGGYKLIEAYFFSGEDYYVQVTTDGKKEVFSASGTSLVDYQYSLTGYNDEGSAKKLSFSTVQEQPLRKMAYLKVTYNDKKGVTSYQEVKASALPEKAKEKLVD
ncbi:MAG: YxeA family protein, partial [Enterococcus italicus]